ncbi:MAG: hypothetical protein ACE5H0_10170 [Bacteroidota bacterium]
MKFIQLSLPVLLLTVGAWHYITAPEELIQRDTVEAVSEKANDAPFAGIDPLETRLTVTAVLVFILLIFTVLLSFKIKRLDRMKGID